MDLGLNNYSTNYEDCPLELFKIREIKDTLYQTNTRIPYCFKNQNPLDFMKQRCSLDAKIELSSKNDKRTIPIDEFIFGARKTKLQPGELLTSVIISREKDRGFSSFKKIWARKYLVISISMVACYLCISNNKIKDIAISVGSCSEVAKRIFSIERQIIEKDINENFLDSVDFSHLNEISPITDIRSTQAYRLKASHLLIKDVVKEAINKYKIVQ